MKSIISFINKNKVCIFIAIISLLIEVFVFNINSLRTIGMEPILVKTDNIENVDKNGQIIEIKDINKKVNNIYVDLRTNSEDEEVELQLYYTDESTINYETNHNMNRNDIIIFTGNERSKYIPCHFIGNVGNIKLKIINESLNGRLYVNRIILNKQIPISISNSIIRLTLMFLISLFIYNLVNGKYMNETYNDNSNKSNYMKSMISISFIILMFIVYGLILKDGMLISFDNDHYSTSFIDALLNGRVSLMEEPPEDLINLNNPYDYSQRENIDCFWDTVYYNGRYYIYFGILPALLIFIPIKVLFNYNISSAGVLLMLNVFSIIMSCKLVSIIIKKWFKNTPNNLYIILTIFFLFGSRILWITARPEFYEMIIASAYFFVIHGMYFVFKSNLITKDEELNYKYLLAGCTFLALAVACRPTTLFVSLLILPELLQLFIKDIKEFKNDKSGLFKFVCCCALPYIIVGIGLMIYNYVRFKNPFDFGVGYQLTVTDMRKMKFSISRMAIGIYSYLFNFPIIEPEFPFVYSNVTLPFYQGQYYNSSIGGGIFTTGILPFILFFIPYLYKHIKEYNKDVLNFIIKCLIVGIIILCFVSSFGGNTGRYVMDFSWLFNIVTILIICFIYEKIKDYNFAKNIFIRIILFIVLISSIIILFMSIIGENNFIRLHDAKNYYNLKYLFSFWM